MLKDRERRRDQRYFFFFAQMEDFQRHKPIFVPENDPLVVRFRVQTAVSLDIEKAIPIHDDAI